MDEQRLTPVEVYERKRRRIVLSVVAAALVLYWLW